MEAVSLMFAVLEISGRELVLSARNNGIADMSFNRKRPTVQKPGFMVEDVARLEDGVLNASRFVDRISVGFLAFCVHCRMRFKDATRITTEPTVDSTGSLAFIETACKVHKSSNRRRARGMQLQVAGHALGINGENWAEARLDLRREAGLDAGADFTLMQCASSDTTFSNSRLSTSEGAIWMRE